MGIPYCGGLKENVNVGCRNKVLLYRACYRNNMLVGRACLKKSSTAS